LLLLLLELLPALALAPEVEVEVDVAEGREEYLDDLRLLLLLPDEDARPLLPPLPPPWEDDEAPESLLLPLPPLLPPRFSWYLVL